MPGEAEEASRLAEPPRAKHAVSLDDFARITAKLEGGAKLDEVLNEEGLTPLEWLRAQQEWLSRMASLSRRGRHQLHERYLERLAAFAAAPDEPASTPSDGQPLVPAPRIVVARAQLPAARKASRVDSVPSLSDSAQPMAPPGRPKKAASPDRRTTLQPVAEVPPVVPFRKAPDALPFAKARRMQRTVPRDLPPALPFDDPPTDGDALAGGTLDGPMPSVEMDLGSTLDGSMPTGSRVLPFAAEGPVGSSITNEDSRVASWPFPRAERWVQDEPTGDPNSGLPFKRSQVPPDPGPSGGNDEPPLVSGAPKSVDHPRTQAFPAIVAAPVAAAAQLTLEQYAWLSSLIDRAPERVDETLSWLRLSVENKVALDAHFAELFRREPAEHARYQQLRSQYDAQP